MEEYRFEHKEPLTQRVVLALRVNTKQLKEHLWLGTEYEVGTALRSLDKPLYLAQTRPLGAFWCEFGKSSAEGWTEAVWALCEALSARKTVERDEQEQKAAELLSRLTVGMPPPCMLPFRFGRCTCAAVEEGTNIKRKQPCGIMRSC